ncbi:MAG TPA: hypothetical protein VM073_07255 [Usitatibacter sp.]|nr:hypothetical protein [Usitatibacter sp.]
MRNRNPKSLWDELRSFMGWSDKDDDEGEQAQDPALLFHLLFTVPLVVAIFCASRRLLAP